VTPHYKEKSHVPLREGPCQGGDAYAHIHPAGSVRQKRRCGSELVGKGENGRWGEKKLIAVDFEKEWRKRTGPHEREKEPNDGGKSRKFSRPLGKRILVGKKKSFADS